jgi:hypothetical protein
MFAIKPLAFSGFTEEMNGAYPIPSVFYVVRTKPTLRRKGAYGWRDPAGMWHYADTLEDAYAAANDHWTRHMRKALEPSHEAVVLGELGMTIDELIGYALKHLIHRRTSAACQFATNLRRVINQLDIDTKDTISTDVNRACNEHEERINNNQNTNWDACDYDAWYALAVRVMNLPEEGDEQ